MHPGIEQIDDYRWRVPKRGRMRVPGLIYAEESLIPAIVEDKAVEQVANVACLPGIVGHSIAMPDIHWGYGFPIGGVAAFDPDEGVVSPGGVGYDINCGVRLLSSALTKDEIAPRLGQLADVLFANIPSGVGSHRRDLRLTARELDGVLADGAGWAVGRGFGEREELELLEERGAIPWAEPRAVSERAKERGRPQLGTVGSGNHFVEVQWVDEVYDAAAAARLGLAQGSVTILIHSGSRGLGYQVCDDFIKVMLKAAAKYAIELPDRQLCCAPLGSEEGRRYLGAMGAAANFAFANRHLMAHWVRESLEHGLGFAPREHRLRTVYDVCHNIAKLERHETPRGTRELCVHRKGATRAFGPGHPALPAAYRDLGQPVLIPGDMGRYSFVMLGCESSAEAFGSACHGAGRRMSRSAAKKLAAGRPVIQEMAAQGIQVRAAGMG
ncbi:MAG: RNA-splicing ligase RtcB, partial [Acidobacteria bacterium]|nr:RNA-splicing ligase RtcB [Acidobacteriota bacterium]